MKRIYTIMLCCLFALPATKTFAQEAVDSAVMVTEPGVAESPAEENTNPEENAKPNTYERHYMDEKRLQSLRSKDEFKYPDLENDTLQIKHDEQAPSGTSHFEGIDASVFLWLIVAIAAVIVILQLTGVNMRQLFSPAKIEKHREDELLSENIHEIPFEKAISNAISAGNYSLATRLMYLQALKLLSDKDLIGWHENKTNWQYVYELKHLPLRAAFRTITSIFEYVQYGNMKVDEAKFELVQDAFQNFKMQLV
jgi:hypothetical protein